MASQEEYLQLITNNPGILQTELHKKLDAGNYGIRQLLKKRLIRREIDREKRVFRLYPNST